MKFWNVAHWVGMVTVGVLGSLKSKTLVADSAIRPAYTRLYIFVDWIWTSRPVCYDFHRSCISWHRLPPSIHQGMVCMTGGVPWEEEWLTWMAQGVARLSPTKSARKCAYLKWDERPLFSRGDLFMACDTCCWFLFDFSSCSWIVILFLPICRADPLGSHTGTPGHQDLQSLEAESATDAVLLIATPGRLQSHVPRSIFCLFGDQVW